MRPTLVTLLCSCIVIAARNQLQECIDNLVGVIGDGKVWLHVTEVLNDGEYIPELKGVTSRLLVVPNEIPKEEISYDAMLVMLWNIDALKAYHIKGLFGCKFHLKAHGVVIAIYRGSDSLGDLFMAFWHCRFANVLVVDGLDVYTYRVVSEGNWTNANPVALGKCSQLASFAKESELLLFKNCRLTIGATLNQPFTSQGTYETNKGLDVAIIRVVMEKLQIVPNFSCDCEITGKNGLSTSSIILNDIWISGVLLRHTNAYDNIHKLYVQDQMVISIFTPMAKPLEPWKQTLYIYDRETWLAIIVSLLAMSCVSYRVNKKLGFIYSYSVLFLNDCTSPTRMKPLFLMWGFFAMLLTGLYGGLLVAYMCKLLLERQLLTFDEIRAAGYKYGMTFEDAIMLETVLNEPLLVWRTEHCHIDGLNCYQNLVQGKFAWITSTHKLLYHVSLNPTHVWFKLPNLMVSYTALEVSLSSPIIPRMEDIVQHLAEAGIISKIDPYQWKPMKNDNDSDFTVVTLAHMYFIFVLFASGILAAIAAFLFELAGWKLAKKKAGPLKKAVSLKKPK